MAVTFANDKRRNGIELVCLCNLTNNNNTAITDIVNVERNDQTYLVLAVQGYSIDYIFVPNEVLSYVKKKKKEEAKDDHVPTNQNRI